MEETKQNTVLTEIMQSMQALLQWAQEHPQCKLSELEERVQKVKTAIGAQLLEAAVAQQGQVGLAEERCSCGGAWVFAGYRKRQVMTSQGVICVKRAYYTCERCGQGFFPPR
jgi:anaerobic glycerol-3-phosphate dehydrogenase